MIYALLEWGMTAVGLSGTFLVGWSIRTRTAGWVCMLIASLGYGLIFMHNGQWGLLTGSIVYAILEVLGLIRGVKKI